jgi:hypothetical protein
MTGVSPNPPSPFPVMAYCTTFCAPFRPHPSPPRGRGGSYGSSPVHGGGQEGGELRVHSCGLCPHPSPPRGRGGLAPTPALPAGELRFLPRPRGRSGGGKRTAISSCERERRAISNVLGGVAGRSYLQASGGWGSSPSTPSPRPKCRELGAGQSAPNRRLCYTER